VLLLRFLFTVFGFSATFFLLPLFFLFLLFGYFAQTLFV